MTIKSDKWIRRQCTMPTFVIKEFVPGPLGQHSLTSQRRFTHESLAEIKKRWYPGGTAYVGQIEQYRELTNDEKDAWRPMIEPFEEGQIRSRERQANFDEQMAYEQGHDNRGAARGSWQMPEGGRIDAQRGLMLPEKIVSYGTSSYGYDVRCADEFKVFTNVNSSVVDPKNFDSNSFVDMKANDEGWILIPPNSFALARTIEYFRIPRNVLTVCLGKSTYARCGIIVNVTPFEPEWEGWVTLEFSNTTPLPAKIYANEGCAQVLFFESDEECDTSYADRGGKYQGQSGVVPPRV